MVTVEQDKAVGNAFDGVTEPLAGGFRLFPGPVDRGVAGLELLHGVIECVGALAHLLGQDHRVLERRVGLGFVRHARLHPHDQGVANPTQPQVFRFQRVNALLQLLGRGLAGVRNGQQAGQSPPP